MKLYAISDLHLGYPANRTALSTLSAHPEDWLIVAGDIGETDTHFRFALDILADRFAKVIWTPGNHDLWTLPNDPKSSLRGEAKYRHLVALCREYGVLTPEDDFSIWPSEGTDIIIAPIFTLYDYSFRPPDIPVDVAVAWAAETNVICVDEYLLHPDPFASRIAWCQARCAYTETRLQALPPSMPLILITHFPPRQDLVQLKYIPRFSIWCGTKYIEDWHLRFPVQAVVYGHLHMPGTHYRDQVRFEEVSFGYPRQRNTQLPIEAYLREILVTPIS